MAPRPTLTGHPAVILGAICLILHAVANQHYGVFRDELYFIVCGRHPDWGYVDQPPLVPLIAGFADWLAPGSLLVLRALPALMSALLIAATIGLTRFLGGRIFAQWLAGLCVLLAPIDLIFGGAAVHRTVHATGLARLRLSADPHAADRRPARMDSVRDRRWVGVMEQVYDLVRRGSAGDRVAVKPAAPNALDAVAVIWVP